MKRPTTSAALPTPTATKATSSWKEMSAPVRDSAPFGAGVVEIAPTAAGVAPPPAPEDAAPGDADTVPAATTLRLASAWRVPPGPDTTTRCRPVLAAAGMTTVVL